MDEPAASTTTEARIHRAWATVVSVDHPRAGLSRVVCRLTNGSLALAVGYPALCGELIPGGRVLLNTTAVDLGLGSGGVHFVIAAADDTCDAADGPGHIIKLRYTPVQTAVMAVEEPASPWHQAMAEADSLDGMPVVCCELVSQVPAVIAGLRHQGKPGSVTVIVTDDAALPVQYCDLLMDLRSAGLVSHILTTGQAFGGDLEAVNVHSALLAARFACEAAFAIVTPGPGAVGTETNWGFSGVAQGEAINAVSALGGRAVGVVRASCADARDRHRGISHHSRTVFTRVALAPFAAAWPSGSGDAYADQFDGLVAETGTRMSGFRVDGASKALDGFEKVWRTWKTMGRGRAEDPLYYEAAAAAGALAIGLREERNR